MAGLLNRVDRIMSADYLRSAETGMVDSLLAWIRPRGASGLCELWRFDNLGVGFGLLTYPEPYLMDEWRPLISEDLLGMGLEGLILEPVNSLFSPMWSDQTELLTLVALIKGPQFGLSAVLGHDDMAILQNALRVDRQHLCQNLAAVWIEEVSPRGNPLGAPVGLPPGRLHGLATDGRRKLELAVFDEDVSAIALMCAMNAAGIHFTLSGYGLLMRNPETPLEELIRAMCRVANQENSQGLAEMIDGEYFHCTGYVSFLTTLENLPPMQHTAGYF